MSELDLKKEDFPLLFERCATRLHIPFMRLAIVLASLLFASYWIVTFATGIASIFTTSDFYNTFMWNWPGCASIVTIMFFSRRLRNRAIARIKQVSPFIKQDEYPIIRERLRKTFSTRYSFTLPLICSFLIAVPMQSYTIVLHPSDIYWRGLQQYFYTGAVICGSMAVIGTWIGLFFALLIGYYSLGTAYILNKIENELGPVSVEDIDRGALKPLASLLMSMTSSFILGIGINLALITVAPMAWWSVSQIALFVSGALLLFFIPLYNLHNYVENKKESTLREIKMRWWQAFKNDELKKIGTIGNIEQRINRIQSWPFSTKTLLELSGYILVPILVWVISYLLK